MAEAIFLHDVTKSFGEKVAVQSLDLAVPGGTITGFIGPNGAGKTTTLRMIMSILFPDRGELSVLGHGSALEAKDRIGYLPEERGVYRKMKVGAFLRHMALLKGVARRDVNPQVRRWLERVGLPEVERLRCDELSRGMQQKIQFIAAVVHEPELLILDEPFSGLDPVNMRQLRELVLEEHRRGATVIFSTHVMVQAEEICDRIVMIHEGVKRLDDRLSVIQSNFEARDVLLDALRGDGAQERIAAVDGVESVKSNSQGSYLVRLQRDADPTTVLPLLAAAAPPSRLELKRPSLEDIFVDIAGRTSEPSAAGQEPRAVSSAGPGGS